MVTLSPSAISAAASTIWEHWSSSSTLPELHENVRPSNRADGYAIQRALAALSGQAIVGWKIAATSVAGQAHIGVDGPLVGSLLANRVLEHGATVSLAGNRMRVAEAEFAFRFMRSLPPRDRAYDRDEVLEAVGSVHPTIEIPDSRYDDFVRVGAAQLIADNACASWLLVGPACGREWTSRDLDAHTVRGSLNGIAAVDGIGANVLGDPRTALTWMVNELRVYGDGIRAGDLVTTGTCIRPVTIAPGDRFHADFGELGTIDVVLT